MRFKNKISLSCLLISCLAIEGTLAQNATETEAERSARASAASRVESAGDIERRTVVENWGALLDEGKVDEAFEKFVGKDFVDHSTYVKVYTGKDKPGFAEEKAFFKAHMAPTPGDTTPMVQRVKVSGSMVTYSGRRGTEIFRVDDGKIQEHWETLMGVMQSGPGASGLGAGGPGAGGPPAVPPGN